MDENKQNELKRLVRNRLYLAQFYLDKNRINEQLQKGFSEGVEIPGFEQKQMKYGEFESKEFIVLMVDIRGSKKIIDNNNGVSDLFQIFYSYSAVIANLAKSYKGTAIEFLGDGVLCLFPIDNNKKNAYANAFSCSNDILNARRVILNPIYQSISLPQINYGIGFDAGITIITRVGFKENNDLKAFGKSIYNVSRLCKGQNEILFSPKTAEELYELSGKKLKFIECVDTDNKKAYKINA